MPAETTRATPHDSAHEQSTDATTDAFPTVKKDNTTSERAEDKLESGTSYGWSRNIEDSDMVKQMKNDLFKLVNHALDEVVTELKGDEQNSLDYRADGSGSGSGYEDGLVDSQTDDGDEETWKSDDSADVDGSGSGSGYEDGLVDSQSTDGDEETWESDDSADFDGSGSGSGYGDSLVDSQTDDGNTKTWKSDDSADADGSGSGSGYGDGLIDTVTNAEDDAEEIYSGSGMDIHMRKLQ